VVLFGSNPKLWKRLRIREFEALRAPPAETRFKTAIDFRTFCSKGVRPIVSLIRVSISNHLLAEDETPMKLEADARK
jgi:hypothetical protein